MKTISTYLEISSYFVIGFSILEFLLVWASGSKARDKRDTLANLSIWALNRPLLHQFTGGMFLLLLEPMSRFIPWKLPINATTVHRQKPCLAAAVLDSH